MFIFLLSCKKKFLQFEKPWLKGPRSHTQSLPIASTFPYSYTNLHFSCVTDHWTAESPTHCSVISFPQSSDRPSNLV